MEKENLVEEIFYEDSSYDHNDALLQERLKHISPKNKWRWHILGKNFEFALDVPWNINWWQRFWLKFFFQSHFEKLT